MGQMNLRSRTVHSVHVHVRRQEDALIGEYSFHLEKSRFGAKNQFPDQEREE